MTENTSYIKRIKISLEYEDGTIVENKMGLTPLRAGENPHQLGYAGIGGYKIIYEGRGMSFTNHLDLIAYTTAYELSQTIKALEDSRIEAIVINKHTIPTIFAVDENQKQALEKAMQYDPKSPFGGVLCTSSPFTMETAQYLKEMRLKSMFTLDVLAAPGFEDGAVELLTQQGSKKERMYNLRVVDVSELDTFDKINQGIGGFNLIMGIGGVPIITENDHASYFNRNFNMEVLSQLQPSKAEMIDAHLAWIGCKYIKSNSFAFIKDGVLIAQCGGQTNREDSAKFANLRAIDFGNSLEGSIGATDSFVFNKDLIEHLSELGVKGVVHPTRKNLTSGSTSPDKAILESIDNHSMVMIRPSLTRNGQDYPWRVFRHI